MKLLKIKKNGKKKLGEKMMESGYAMYIEPDVVIPMHKDYDSIPSDVEPKQTKKIYKKKK